MTVRNAPESAARGEVANISGVYHRTAEAITLAREMKASLIGDRTTGMGHGQTKWRTRPTLFFDRFDPFSAGKINQINPVAPCQDQAYTINLTSGTFNDQDG
jgi:hypothetical protein